MSTERRASAAGEPGWKRHASLDDRFDPAARIIDYDPVWPALAEAELRRVMRGRA